MDAPDTPSTARMIDYWLGGGHHYPVDVAAAQAFEGVYGPCAHEFEALRSFLGRAVEHVVARGIDEFLVLGAGIPTQGSVHEVAPHARVLYTDIDPANVDLGRRILGTSTRAAYAFGDATDTDAIDPGVMTRALPGWGKAPSGVVFLGLAAFIDDERLALAFDRLYDSVAAGSCLAFDFDTDVLAANPDALAMMGPDFHMRDPASFAALLGRWRTSGEGIVPVAQWGRTAAGTVDHAAFYGGVAVKEDPGHAAGG